MAQLQSIIGNTDTFFNKVFNNIERAGINFHDLDFREIDHIGVRTESLDQYNKMKKSLISHAVLALEIPIRGRNVATYTLYKPIKYKEYTIPALELLAPAEDNKYKKGPDHIEVVVEKDLEDIARIYPNLLFTLVRPKSLNPELILKFKDMTAIKLHRKSLLEVIELEKEYGIKEIN